MADEKQTTTRSGDEALLQEIRDRYRYASEAWEEIRKERQKDMRYICGNPWEDSGRKAREDAGRPVVNHDELNQYVNQAVNNLRQNKRGIKVEPGGNGADGKSAQLRQDIIRTIEYRNKAQDAYLRAGQVLTCLGGAPQMMKSMVQHGGREPGKAILAWGLNPPGSSTAPSVMIDAAEEGLGLGFGDDWEHEIVVEKVIADNSGSKRPLCRGGKRRRPMSPVHTPPHHC